MVLAGSDAVGDLCHRPGSNAAIQDALSRIRATLQKRPAGSRQCRPVPRCRTSGRESGPERRSAVRTRDGAFRPCRVVASGSGHGEPLMSREPQVRDVRKLASGVGMVSSHATPSDVKSAMGHHGRDRSSAGEPRRRILGQWRSANAARSSGGGSFSAKCSSTLTIRPCRTSRKDTANREVSPSLISVTVAAASAHSSVRRTVQRQSSGQLSLRAMKFPGPRMRSCAKAFGTGGVDFSPRIRSGDEGRREDSAASAPASFRS